MIFPATIRAPEASGILSRQNLLTDCTPHLLQEPQGLLALCTLSLIDFRSTSPTQDPAFWGSLKKAPIVVLWAQTKAQFQQIHLPIVKLRAPSCDIRHHKTHVHCGRRPGCAKAPKSLRSQHSSSPHALLLLGILSEDTRIRKHISCDPMHVHIVRLQLSILNSSTQLSYRELWFRLLPSPDSIKYSREHAS